MQVSSQLAKVQHKLRFTLLKKDRNFVKHTTQQNAKTDYDNTDKHKALTEQLSSTPNESDNTLHSDCTPHSSDHTTELYRFYFYHHVIWTKKIVENLSCMMKHGSCILIRHTYCLISFQTALLKVLSTALSLYIYI
jgi:hypothetical protein